MATPEMIREARTAFELAFRAMRLDCDDTAAGLEAMAFAALEAALTPSPLAVGGVSEDAVDAACDAFKDRQTGDCDHMPTMMRAALEAASPFLRSPAAVADGAEPAHITAIKDSLSHATMAQQGWVIPTVQIIALHRVLKDAGVEIPSTAPDRSLLVAADAGVGEARARAAVEVLERMGCRWDAEEPGWLDAPAPKVGDGLNPPILVGSVTFATGPKGAPEVAWNDVLWELNDSSAQGSGVEVYIVSGGIKNAPAIAADTAPVADTAPERDPRNDPQPGDVKVWNNGARAPWVFVCHGIDAYVVDADLRIPVFRVQWEAEPATWLTAAQYAAEKGE